MCQFPVLSSSQIYFFSASRGSFLFQGCSSYVEFSGSADAPHPHWWRPRGAGSHPFPAGLRSPAESTVLASHRQRPSWRSRPARAEDVEQLERASSPRQLCLQPGKSEREESQGRVDITWLWGPRTPGVEEASCSLDGMLTEGPFPVPLSLNKGHDAFEPSVLRLRGRSQWSPALLHPHQPPPPPHSGRVDVAGQRLMETTVKRL